MVILAAEGCAFNICLTRLRRRCGGPIVQLCRAKCSGRFPGCWVGPGLMKQEYQVQYIRWTIVYGHTRMKDISFLR